MFINYQMHNLLMKKQRKIGRLWDPKSKGKKLEAGEHIVVSPHEAMEKHLTGIGLDAVKQEHVLELFGNYLRGSAAVIGKHPERVNRTAYLKNLQALVGPEKAKEIARMTAMLEKIYRDIDMRREINQN